MEMARVLAIRSERGSSLFDHDFNMVRAGGAKIKGSKEPVRFPRDDWGGRRAHS